MHRLFFVCLAFTPAVAFAGNLEHRFVHIHKSVDEHNYITDITNIGGMGYFYFLDKKWTADDLRIRVRIYHPVKEDFELFLEQDAEIGAPFQNEPATLQYIVNLKPTKAPKPGKYLYRVDCFDKTGEKEKLLASNSVFITFVERQRPLGLEANRPRPAGKQQVSLAKRRFALPGVSSSRDRN